MGDFADSRLASQNFPNGVLIDMESSGQLGPAIVYVVNLWAFVASNREELAQLLKIDAATPLPSRALVCDMIRSCREIITRCNR